MVNKKGSYIMEAAIVLPVIIITMITCILIVMFFYSQISERCRLHIELRKEAGIMTEKTEYLYDISGLNEARNEIDIRKKGFGGTVYGKQYIVMKEKGVLFNRGAVAVEGSCSAVDAPKFVRYCIFVKGLKDEQ